MHPAFIWAWAEARMRSGNVLALGGCCRHRSCRAWLVCSMVGDLWGRWWGLGSVFEVRPLKAPAVAFCCLRFAFSPVGRSRVQGSSSLLFLHLLCWPSCCYPDLSACRAIVSLALLQKRILGLYMSSVLVQCRKSVLCDPLDLARWRNHENLSYSVFSEGWSVTHY